MELNIYEKYALEWESLNGIWYHYKKKNILPTTKIRM